MNVLDMSNMSVQEEHVEEIKNRNVFDIIATRPQQGIQIEESLDVSDTISDINTHEGVQAVENPDSSDTRNKTTDVPVESSTKEKPYKYKCQYCSKGFSLKTSKLTHERSHRCRYCKEILNVQDKSKHEKSHTKHLELPLKYKCKYCSKRFRKKDNRVNHERIHTKEKPYKCAFCSRAFPRKDSMKQHELHRHIQKPFVCKYCGKNFAQETAKDLHEKTHTYSYKCCDKSFATLLAYRLHVTTFHKKREQLNKCYDLQEFLRKWDNL